MYRLPFKNSCRCALQQMRQQSCRHYNFKKGPPPNTREAGFGKFFLFLSPFAMVGGAVTYANYDPEFRQLLEKNVPGAESFLKVALQEEEPFQNIRKQFVNVAKSIEDVTSTVTGLFIGSEKEASTVAELPKEKPKPVPQTATPSSSPQEDETTKPTQPAAEILSKPEEKLPSSILDLERDIEISASLAVKEYNKAIEILQNFNADVRQVVEKAVEKGEPSWWVTLKNKTSARDTSVATAERLAREAISKIEKCEIALSEAATASNQDQILAVRNKIRTFISHINHIKDELYQNKDIAAVSEKYWKNVEQARNYFIDEIESIFPGLNLADQKINLSKEDLDLFIMYAYTHVLAYQKELQRVQTDGELRLKHAIDAYRGDNDSDAVKAQIEYLLESEKRRLAIDNQKKIFQIRSEAEKQLRLQLKSQAEAHMDHLKDAIALRESNLKRSYSREFEDKLAAEKANYKLQLATMLGKLRGMDAALQARAESERSAHQAQALWAACQSLWSTVKTGEPGVNWRSKLRPLESEIRAISRVAQGDELVTAIIANLPSEASERGVFPEDALRERFNNVESTARKYALVREDGASIPMYLLSYLQSLFIMRPDNPVSDDELQNKTFNYSKLDTYDILNRARYYVERGDLMQALKYMNLLQGAPRKIASDWLKETRLLLETQQAANTLMAHAAASGLLYL